MLDQRRAQKAWLAGAKAFHGGDVDDAAAHFARAVETDEGMADAWLGLHAAGVQSRRSLAAMAEHERRFGEERKRNSMLLDSRFEIGPYVNYRLRSHLDLWCAVTAGHIDREEYELATKAIRRTKPEPEQARYLRGRLAFATGDHPEAITQLRQVFGTDRFLEVSARLLSGAMLVKAGAFLPAKDHLNWVMSQTFAPSTHAEARYILGLIARREGDEQTAMRHFEHAYALNPKLAGLKDAMQHREVALVGVSSPGATSEDTELDEDQSAGAEEPAETVEDVLVDLYRNIGQEGVKRQVRSMLAQARAQVARRENGLKQARMTQHFVFTGPPGTGKTTIARIIARLYKALGALESGHVVEVDRSGLVGKFHGHTVAQTQEKIDEAMGGVLFIDEAYSLQNDKFTDGDPFGTEAVDTLLKRMEDDRDQFVVIAAGYPEPMEKFLDSNPGLRSRFTTTITFDSYSADELVAIAELTAEDAGDTLTGEGRAALWSVLDRPDGERALNTPSFGNARFVRTLIEKAAQYRDMRLFDDPDTDAPDVDALTSLTPDDVRAAAQELGQR